jgi:hypothetical protein
MSACQSQASSCATPGVLTAPATPVVMPDGADALKISDAVVSKVAEMLAEEGDPACSCASSSPAAAARASSTASPSTTRPRKTTCACNAAPSPWWSTR